MNRYALHPMAALAASSLLTLGACSFAARSGDIYRADTRALLETRNSELQECFDGVRETETKASGQVTAAFIVEADTGAVRDPQIVTDQTSAPPSLQQCVLSSLGDLQLQPGDNREGKATFSWTFTTGGAAVPSP